MDVVEKAVDVADQVQRRAEPVLERAPLPDAVKRRLVRAEGDFEAPEPEPNDSPFLTEEDEPEDEAPLGDPEKPAQIYGDGTDPWTGRCLQLLEDQDIEHGFVDLESDESGKLAPRLVRETKQNAGPYVFLRGEFIGGFNALDEISRLGQLEVRTAAERDDRAVGGVRIVIPSRTENEAPPGERGGPDDRR